MVKSNLVYEGNLRCRLTHEPSGTVILTDAPKDNMGKGESFSPTDLLAAALGSCMVTIMDIASAKNNIHLEGVKVDVAKEMITAPERKIGTITVNLHMPKGVPADKRSILEHAAHACPVHKSLHPDVQTPITFNYPD